MIRRCKELLCCQRGNTLVVMVAVMPMLLGAAALAVDVAQWALTRRHLQRVADTGAIAGGNAVYQKEPAKPAVDRTLPHNNQVALSSPIIVENAPTVGQYAGDAAAVRVVASSAPQLPFASFFLGGTITIGAEATAKAIPDPRYCLVSLEEGNTPGFDFSGSAGVVADCGIMTNSRAKPTALTFGGGSASVKASEVAAVGHIQDGSNWAPGTKLMSLQPRLPDPYDYAPEASSFASPCSNSSPVFDSKTKGLVTPGCWANLSFKGEVKLQAGTYVVNGGILDFGSGAIVTATGPVSFVLTGPNPANIASLSFSGNAVVDLSAPTSGPLKNILFYQDRRASELEKENFYAGNALNKLVGAMYFPGSNLDFSGNSSLSGCLTVVARRVSFTGSSAAAVTCADSERAKLHGSMVRLVG